MSAVHLKPCPYCGRAARYVAADYVDNTGQPWPFAECDACNTGAPVEIWTKRAQPADQHGEPVVWGAPKTVGQLIRQLQTLDPALETVALYRLPDDIPGIGGKVKQGHISTSYERMEGIWLGPYKGDGRKVLAFWTKLDPRPVPDGEFLMQTPPPDRELVTRRCECPVCWPDHPAHANRPR